jgi:4-alpha-glucanotransferase
MKTFLKKRACGILLHISSLPSQYGIGDIGPAAHRWLQFLADSGMQYWQILPLSPTSEVFGNSPYMSFSALAGNPLLISPDVLLEYGLLAPGDIKAGSFSEYAVDYPQVIRSKQKLLQASWQRFTRSKHVGKLDIFCEKNSWVKDYALFMALRGKLEQKPWFKWPEELRNREPQALAKAEKDLADRINYFCYEQMLFFNQWRQLREAAKQLNIRIIGDLPIYVGLDCVDVWAHQEIFQLDPVTCRPTHVAGVPPDYFSEDGQRWGNPLYCWDSKEKEIRDKLYGWWEKRLRTLYQTVDLVRLDHFRGFEDYYAIPASHKTATRGSWKKGPGIAFFHEMQQRMGRLPVIAEDLGIITPEVEALRKGLGYPGMKILLFAFDGDNNNSYLLHNIEENSVVYTGTHDNDTAVGWYLVAPEHLRRQAKIYCNRDDDETARFHWDMIFCAMISPAKLAILPMQDVLGFGNDCRMNTPSTHNGNWQWRCAERFITPGLADWLLHQVTRYGRARPAADDTDKAAKADMAGQR